MFSFIKTRILRNFFKVLLIKNSGYQFFLIKAFNFYKILTRRRPFLRIKLITRIIFNSI